ncbi:MAG: OmpH family outer membrane protein [Bacteroides sp.]|nr:OmpH family outer membrane protein [Bacteroides sp.]MCM1379590.1 OmpH family outer membrane protein [Bacteroides sp.]MCM1446028.1 OmpH family outer membrane protein [Prevotella sp.]
MIKKLLLALAIMLPTCAFAQAKFGVVNAQDILQVMPEAKDAQDKLAAASKTLEDEYGRLVDEINKKYEEYQNLSADSPASIRERREQEIQDLTQRMQAFQQKAQQDLQRQEQTLMAPVQTKLLDAIKAVGAEKGFSMIFPDGVAIYTGTDIIDVTADVKVKLGL